jgi:virginiamycin B lyase
MVAIAALTLLLLQFNVAGASPWQGRLNLAFNYLTSSRLGQVLLFRIGLAIIATYFVWLIPRSNGNYLELHGPPVGFAATLLLTNSLVSHSAAVDYLPVLDIASDWLHQLAAAIWIGGLFHLVLSLSKIWNLRDDIRARLIALLIPRFSAVAIASVGVLAVTGFYSLWLQVGSVPSLFSTPYGITLIVKLLLAAPIVFLGGFNHFVVHGRLSKSIAGKLGSAATRLVSHFHRFVRIEAALGLIVLLAVGILTSLPPAVQQPPSADRDATPLILTNEAEGVRFTLRVSPAQIGSNTFEVTISDGNNDPITNAELVLVAFRYLERDMGEARARFNNVGKGEYALQGTYLSLPGRWQLEVLVRRPSAYDAIARFEFNVPELELEVLERPLLGSESSPYGIAIDTSGNVWFAESGAGKIGVLNPRTGEIKEFSLPDSSARPLWLTIDQGDTIWITDPQNNQVVNFDPITGISDGYEIPTVDAVPAAIAIDYNGDVWFTELIAGKIGRIDSTTQLIQEYLIPTPQSVPTGIAIGDNKTIWFTEAASGKIARLDTLTGEILEFEPTTFNLIAPTDITVAEDGSVWLTEHGGNRITKFDPNEGTFTPHALTSEQAWPWALAFDNLQRLWFVEHGANMIGTLDVETGIVKEFTITTPDSDAQLLAIDQSNNVWFTMPGSGKVGVITLSNSGLHIQSTPTRDSAFGAVLTSLGLAIGVVAVGVYAMNRRRFNKLRNAFDVVVQDR